MRGDGIVIMTPLFQKYIELGLVSAVGITMMDKTKHTSAKCCEEKNVSRHIRNPLFKFLEELNRGIYEIE